MPRNPDNLGFTRREVVVVITLVVLAVAVALPLYQGQKAAARQQASANNLMQWGIALNLFLIENKNQLPAVGPVPGAAKDPYAWYNALPLYLSQKPLQDLPEESRPRPGQVSLWTDPSAELPADYTEGEYYFTYAMNRWLQPKPVGLAYKVYELADPGGTVFLTEVAGRDPGAMPADAAFRYVTGKPKKPAAHVLFCDGHVELVDREVLSDRSGANDPEVPLLEVNWVPFYMAPRPQQ